LQSFFAPFLALYDDNDDGDDDDDDDDDDMYIYINNII